MLKVFIIFLFLFLVTQGIHAQCSDAGVCSLHSNDIGIFRRSGIGVDYLNGYSGMKNDIRYESAKLSGYYWFSRVLNIGAVLPLNRQRGRLGTSQGVGDLLLVLDYIVNDHPGDITMNGETSLLRGTFEATAIQIGAKIATGSINQNDLPLLYQNGLGSNDVLLGVMYSAANPHNFGYDLFAGGFTLQIPFGIAGNRSDSIERGVDLLGRIAYQYPILHSFGLKGEILAIQRLTKSTLHQYKFVGADGFPDSLGTLSPDPYKVNDNILQINFSASATYNIQQDVFFETGFTVPLLDKKVNYDGLKRSYTLFASVNYHFK